MHAPAIAALAGVVGAVAFLAVVTMGNAIGMTRMRFLYLLGTMISPKTSDAAASGIGLVLHLMMGAIFGVAHGAILSAIGVSSVGAAVGASVLTGMVHGAVILVAMPMLLSGMHPLVKAGAIERPGAAMTGFGALTPVGSLMAHVVFAVVAMWIYAGAGLKV